MCIKVIAKGVRIQESGVRIIQKTVAGCWMLDARSQNKTVDSRQNKYRRQKIKREKFVH